MKAEAVEALKFLNAQTTQFIIPVYQRTYSWDIEHCEKLWQDIDKIGTNKKNKSTLYRIYHVY